MMNREMLQVSFIAVPFSGKLWHQMQKDDHVDTGGEEEFLPGCFHLRLWTIDGVVGRERAVMC